MSQNAKVISGVSQKEECHGDVPEPILASLEKTVSPKDSFPREASKCLCNMLRKRGGAVKAGRERNPELLPLIRF